MRWWEGGQSRPNHIRPRTTPPNPDTNPTQPIPARLYHTQPNPKTNTTKLLLRSRLIITRHGKSVLGGWKGARIFCCRGKSETRLSQSRAERRNELLRHCSQKVSDPAVLHATSAACNDEIFCLAVFHALLCCCCFDRRPPLQVKTRLEANRLCSEILLGM